MNELRVILLIAGILLIVALYAWGMRSRARTGGGAETRKPAVFTGSADSFESETPPLETERAADDEDDDSRLEPSLSIETSVPVHAASSRREPTWSGEEGDVTPAGRGGGERGGDTRIEPSFGAVTTVDDEPDVPSPPPPQRPAQKIIAMRVNAVAPSRLDGARLKNAILAEELTFGRYDIFHRLHTDGRPVFSVASLREPGTFDLAAMASTQYPGIALFVVLPGPVPAAEAIDQMLYTARALAAQLGGGLADERGAPMTPLRLSRLREEALEFERTAGAA